MQPTKRLLIITNRYPAGPDDVASPFVHDFRTTLETAGVEVDVVTPYYQAYQNDAAYIDDSVHAFPWSDGSTVISQLPLYHPASLLKIKRYFRCGYDAAANLIEKKKYDGILALWAAPSGYIAYKLSEKYKIPYAVWALGSDINSWAQLPIVGRVILKVLNNANRLYADGYELAMKVNTMTGRDCRFIPSYHAIDIKAIKPDIPEKRFICVGRVEKSKGVFDLLEAFRLFAVLHWKWKLYFVGSGRAEEELRASISDNRLDDSVFCCGYLPRGEIDALLINSTAAVIPSHADSLPLTFGEAMQAGVPVICSDVGDMPHFVEHYRVGSHYPAGDAQALAERMDDMITDAAKYARNCASVLAELDIKNSTRAIFSWLETVSPSKERIVKNYADA